MRAKTVRGQYYSFFLLWVVLFCAGVGYAATIYVDDNATNDPGPGDPTVSDPLENGSAEHPYDDIQRAINAAQNGMTIAVVDGLYIAKDGLNYNGKPLYLRSLNGPAHCTILLKSKSIQFTNNETESSVLDGFTVTGSSNPSSVDAISISNSNPRILHCIIARNSGFGIVVSTGSPLIQGCTLLDNQDGINGRPMTGTIRDCEIRNNQYCGISLNTCNDVLIENCLIAENGTRKDTYWPGVNISDSTAIVNHCTIAMQIYEAGNTIGSGSGIKVDYGKVQIENSIIWGCYRSIYQVGSWEVISVGFSDIQGGYSGTGNIKDDPQFVRMGGWVTTEGLTQWVPGDYHLRQTSPCINTGLNGTTGATEDIDGQPRIAYGRTDMGADEYLLTNFDGNVAVNLADFGIFAGQWLRSDCGVCDWMDYSGDESVGVEDLMTLLGDWLIEAKPEFEPVPYWYWRLDGNYKDSIAQLIGVPSGNPIFSDDHPKGIGTKSLMLDGDDSVRLYDYGSISGNNPRTQMAWIRTTQTEGDFLNYGSSSYAGTLWRLGLVEGKLNLDVGGGSFVRSSTPVNTGQWVHVAVDFPAGATTSDQIRLYVNGIREVVTRGPTSTIQTNGNVQLTLGKSISTRYLIGSIDDVRFYNCTLSPKMLAEIVTAMGL